MVNSVSTGYANPSMYATARTAVQATGRYSNDIENMVKYINGQPLTPQDEMSVSEVVKSNLPFVGLFGAVASIPALKANKFNVVKTIKDINAASAIKTRGQAFEAAKSGVADKFKDVFKSSVAVDEAGRWKIFKVLDKIPGYSKLRHTGFGQMMKKTNAGWMAVIGGGIELLTQVVPAFQQGGFTSGMKQLAKSSVKTVADTAGFVAGDIVGRGAGAAIGTMICPGIGTAIGGFVGGFLGGIVCSTLAGKAVRKVLGPTEIEKIQNQQVSQAAQQIEADPNAKLQIAQQTLQQAETVLAQDPQNADALAAKAAAENTLAQLSQTSTQTQGQQPTQQPMMPTNNGNTMYGFNGVPVVPGFNGFGYDMNIYRQSLQNTSTVSALGNATTATAQSNPFLVNRSFQTQPVMQTTVA